MEILPSEIIFLVIKKMNDVENLINTKMSCKLYNSMISKFLINKSILNKKIFNYKPYIRSNYYRFQYNCCINNNCWDDTVYVYQNIYNQNYYKYCHFVQQAVNTSVMTINNKIYNVNTPYCCECFTNFILIGDNKKVKHNYKMNTINIDYL